MISCRNPEPIFLLRGHETDVHAHPTGSRRCRWRVGQHNSFTPIILKISNSVIGKGATCGGDKSGGPTVVATEIVCGSAVAVHRSALPSQSATPPLSFSPSSIKSPIIHDSDILSASSHPCVGRGGNGTAHGSGSRRARGRGGWGECGCVGWKCRALALGDVFVLRVLVGCF